MAPILSVLTTLTKKESEGLSQTVGGKGESELSWAVLTNRIWLNTIISHKEGDTNYIYMHQSNPVRGDTGLLQETWPCN